MVYGYTTPKKIALENYQLQAPKGMRLLMLELYLETLKEEFG